MNGSPGSLLDGILEARGYYTQPDSGGRRIYDDGHPGIDYAFPLNTPVSAAASGIAHRRTIGTIQVVTIIIVMIIGLNTFTSMALLGLPITHQLKRGQQIVLAAIRGPNHGRSSAFRRSR